MTGGGRWAAVVVLLALAFPAAAGEGWLRAEPGYPWSFPRDHWPHPEYRSEWWYLTGHLEAVDDPEQRFGFQFTFFRVGLLPEAPAIDSAWAARALIMGHASLSDLTGRTHRFGEVLYRAVPLLGAFDRYPAAAIAWSVGPPGTREPWALRWNGRGFDVAAGDDAAGFALELRTWPERPVVLHGESGFSRKGSGPDAGASNYYSLTRLRTEGTVTAGDRAWEVRGLSWMDKEFGTSQLTADQVGWDWFSLQLEDGRDLMLYVLRDRDGGVDHASGTLVETDGSVRSLRGTDFRLEAVAAWHSAASGATYPSGWRLELPGEGLRLRIEPELADQENVVRLARDLAYWEGAVRVMDQDGARLGQGYVELTGYAGDGGLGFLRTRQP